MHGMSLFTLPSFALKLVVSTLQFRDTLEKWKGSDLVDFRLRVSGMGLYSDQNDIK